MIKKSCEKESNKTDGRLFTWIEKFIENNYDKPVQAFGIMIWIWPLVMLYYYHQKSCNPR